MVEIFAIPFSLLLRIAAKAATVFIFESPLSMVLLTTESENHIREMELCLKMRPWVESFGILDYGTRLRRNSWRYSVGLDPHILHNTLAKPDAIGNFFCLVGL